MSKSKSENIDTITKEQFLKYAKQRKELDKTFGATITSKFDEKQAAYERQLIQQRERYAVRSQDEDVKKYYRLKNKAYNERKKAGKTDKEPEEEKATEEEPEEPEEVIVKTRKPRIGTMF